MKNPYLNHSPLPFKPHRRDSRRLISAAHHSDCADFPDVVAICPLNIDGGRAEANTELLAFMSTLYKQWLDELMSADMPGFSAKLEDLSELEAQGMMKRLTEYFFARYAHGDVFSIVLEEVRAHEVR